MIKKAGWILILVFSLSVISCKREKIVLETQYIKVAIDGKGLLTSFFDKTNSVEYFPEGEKAALLTIYKDPEYILPVSAVYNSADNKIILDFPNGSKAVIGVNSKDAYLRLELLSLEPRNDADAVVWGPYPVAIDEKIGETICVVRNKDYAVGMQALNINTIEGLPDGDDNGGGGAFIDPLPGQQLPDSLKDKIGQKVDVNVNITGDMPEYVRLYRGSAAVKKPFGSELRLFSRDRRKPRVIKNWLGNKDHVQYVESIDVDFAGSAVALFGCPEPMTLDIIEKIETGEGLPHPMLDGVWLKRSAFPGEAYLLNEGDPMKSIQYAKECGFKLIHAGDIFQTWGHFGYSEKRFPGGLADIKKVTEVARKEGISLGVHTLGMFTTKNDSYISPVPSDSLCKTGSSVLAKAAGLKDDIIYLADPAYFRYLGNTHTVKIGKELINFRKVSDDEPWRLIDCQRGMYGTKPASYEQGAAVDKLTNDSYSGFYPDIKLQDKYALKLAEVCNETGIDLMDFDGYGGESPTGHGTYGAARFIDLWYRNIDRYRIACGAGTFHYYWHIYAFMNWGEPWYNALRESQVNYRIENQRYFERNLMPGMLGWFTLNPEFRPEEVEWIQARSAAFNAGYLLRVDESIEKNGYRDQLFEAIREWQKVRRLDAFTPDQRERMKNPKNEFHLEKTGDKSWNLYSVKLSRGFVHKFRYVQTGEPVTTKFTVENPFEEQPLQFYATATGSAADQSSSVSHLQFKINDYQVLEMSVSLKKDDRIICDREKVYLCDNFWKRLKVISDGKIPVLAKGNSEIVVTSEFSNSNAPELAIEFKSSGSPEAVKK
ncbi:MAG: hypothetical protein IPN68_12675 [Bacteroidetes bacterium]|nr:hypothetical protein [Bacteroidota bacterium]